MKHLKRSELQELSDTELVELITYRAARTTELVEKSIEQAHIDPQVSLDWANRYEHCSGYLAEYMEELKRRTRKYCNRNPR